MSHNHDKTIICPNCGYDAKYNYCARCGQENHLHKDTFLGLIGHFVGHYFHYDSKFWKTLKTLWFKPGELTLAYMRKERQRYIPPISLYIFVSFVFFLAATLMPDIETPAKNTQAVSAQQDRDSSVNSIYNAAMKFHLLDSAFVKKKIAQRAERDRKKTQQEKHLEENLSEGKDEKLQHLIPKVFFFMIPFTAFLLQLLFFRRKEKYFVDHAVFSLHYHSFWFSVMLINTLYPFDLLSDWISAGTFIWVVVYFVYSMKKVYSIGWARSIFSSIFIALSYGVCFIIALSGMFYWRRIVSLIVHRHL